MPGVVPAWAPEIAARSRSVTGHAVSLPAAELLNPAAASIPAAIERPSIAPCLLRSVYAQRAPTATQGTQSWSVLPDAPYRMFSLPYIRDIEPTGEYFEQDPEFSLEDFSKQAFGVFHEEPFDVAWRFSPRAAPDAREFVFHPDQVTEEQDDGSLIVRFHAGGALEMCWHLYCWGEDVEVLEPKHLAEMCRENRRNWPGLP